MGRRRTRVGLVTTTMVASIATAPFAAYHFQTLNPYGLVGNALALPLVSLVVMPAAVLGVVAYPFGLDGPVWQVMGVAVSRCSTSPPGSVAFGGSTVVIPALGSGALALLSLALLVATIAGLRRCAAWRSCRRSLGLAFAARPARYDIFVDRDGLGAAIRNAAGRLALVGKPSDFVVEQWLRADGDRAGRRSGMPRRRRACAATAAAAWSRRADGRPVAFVQEFSAFEEDCRRAAIIISRLEGARDLQRRARPRPRRTHGARRDALRMTDAASQCAPCRKGNARCRAHGCRSAAGSTSAATAPAQPAPPARAATSGRRSAATRRTRDARGLSSGEPD